MPSSQHPIAFIVSRNGQFQGYAVQVVSTKTSSSPPVLSLGNFPNYWLYVQIILLNCKTSKTFFSHHKIISTWLYSSLEPFQLQLQLQLQQNKKNIIDFVAEVPHTGTNPTASTHSHHTNQANHAQLEARSTVRTHDQPREQSTVAAPSLYRPVSAHSFHTDEILSDISIATPSPNHSQHLSSSSKCRRTSGRKWTEQEARNIDLINTSQKYIRRSVSGI